MNKRNSFNKFFLVVFSLFLFSCSDNLLDSPKSEGDNDSTKVADSIDAPVNLTATNGGFKVIDLSWKSVRGAKSYLIFAADSPFDEYVQIWETGEISYSVSVPAGKSQFYKVQAKNYKDVLSSFSNVASGSSLARPVITAIEQNAEGNSATVNWWMENCTNSTYENLIRYTVKVYSADGSTVLKEVSVAGNETQVTIEGLEPKTKYNFLVEAYIISAQTNVESSGMIDSETARKLIPEAPANLEVGQGVSAEEICLSWDCPQYVDVSAGNGIFEQRPVYFKIYRKKTDSTEDYVEIVHYIGSVLQGDSSKNIFNFDCLTQTCSDERLRVEKSTEDGAVACENYKYVGKSKIFWTDKTELERGIQYSYKVQAFVDDVKKSISSDKCAAEENGWLISVPVLSVKDSYIVDDSGLKYSKIIFGFNGEFENFGKDYSYILVESKTDFSGENLVETQFDFENFEELLKNERIFENPKEQSGYYTYKIFIAPTENKNPESAYTRANIPGKFVVTDDSMLVPKITTFEVMDGFSDRFEIQFNYIEEYVYYLCWIPVVDGVEQEQQYLSLQKDKLSISDAENGEKIAKFIHEAPAGEKRTYILEVENNKITANRVCQNVSETLGKAKLSNKEKFYEKIQVEWQKVQKADEYSVEAFFTEIPENKISVGEDSILSEDGKTFICTINEPFGWNNAEISGQSVTVKIISKNTGTGNSTESTIEASTMGPALVELNAEKADRNSMSVSWKKIDGAKGYVVGRGKCADGLSGLVESADSYFVSADGTTVNIEGSLVEKERVEVTLDNGRFTLTDKYADTTENETNQIAYKKNQSEIVWGLEYKYSVIPVLEEDDFVFEAENSKIGLTRQSKVLYENLDFVSNGTDGYGLDLKASKATDNEKIQLTWKQPFDGSSKMPSLYIRESKNSDGSWKKYDKGNFERSDNELYQTQIVPENPLEAYDFLVVYESASSEISAIPDSFEKKLKETMAEESPLEQQNKGYILSLDKINANCISGYAEKIEWKPYDFDNRKLGPDYYELQIFNPDKACGWTTIGKIDVDVANNDFGEKINISAYEDSAKIKRVNPETVGKAWVEIEPVFDLQDGQNVGSGGTNTSGMLKVLRNFKHYYRLVAYRKISEEKTVTASVGSDFSVYGYRNITDEEFAKSVSLVLADAIFQCGISPGGENSVSEKLGKFTIGHTGGTKTVYWGTDGEDYQHIFKGGSPSGKEPFASCFILNFKKIEQRSAVDGKTLYHLPETEITVTTEKFDDDKTYPSSYSGKFSISVGAAGYKGLTQLSDGVKTSWILTIKKDGKVVKSITEENKEKFLEWFPYDIGTSHGSEEKTFNSAIPVYQSPWWESQESQ